MKKLITILTLFIATASFGQLKVSNTVSETEIGKVGPFGLPYHAKITKSGDTCTLTYKDLEYTTMDVYHSFKFKAADLEALYDMFKNNINAEDGVEKTVELDESNVLFFLYKKTLGKVYAYVEHKDGANQYKLPWFNYKQVDKLFGKK